MISKSNIVAQLMFLAFVGFGAATAWGSEIPATFGVPYRDMPRIAPIGVRIGHHLPIPEQAKGPPVDPAKKYRLQEMGKGLYKNNDREKLSGIN